MVSDATVVMLEFYCRNEFGMRFSTPLLQACASGTTWLSYHHSVIPDEQKLFSVIWQDRRMFEPDWSADRSDTSGLTFGGRDFLKSWMLAGAGTPRDACDIAWMLRRSVSFFSCLVYSMNL
jgi:hypothetical protein